MSSWKRPNTPDDRSKHVSSLASGIDHKNTVFIEMSRKLEHKDNLLEAALEHIQKSRLEKDRFKATESELKGKLRDLEAEIEDLKAENQTLVVKERICNDELQAAREEAIRWLQTMLTHHRTLFGIKNMGELSRKPFEDMCMKKCFNRDWRKESAKLCSFWDANVKNPHWHPFKRIKINGTLKEVIDEDDAKLKQLRSEGSRDAYEAVVNAVAEMNEYNPSGRYPVLELWNNKEKRKASLEEIVQYIIKQLKASNSKRKRVHFV